MRGMPSRLQGRAWGQRVGKRCVCLTAAESRSSTFSPHTRTRNEASEVMGVVMILMTVPQCTPCTCISSHHLVPSPYIQAHLSIVPQLFKVKGKKITRAEKSMCPNKKKKLRDNKIPKKRERESSVRKCSKMSARFWLRFPDLGLPLCPSACQLCQSVNTCGLQFAFPHRENKDMQFHIIELI